MTYNAWPNWPTWNTHLWITNDPSTYESAREAMEGLEGEAAEKALREFVEDELIDMAWGSLQCNLLGYVMNEIDWSAIVEALKET